MSAPPVVNHRIADRCYRWSHAGRDGACLGHCRMERRAAPKSPPGINLATAIDFGTPVVPASPLDQCQLQRRSALAAPATTTKSP